jgi:hypothetical protein
MNQFPPPEDDAFDGFDDAAEEPLHLDVESPAPTNDADWDVFLADDDDLDPLPEHGDFWDDGTLDE